MTANPPAPAPRPAAGFLTISQVVQASPLSRPATFAPAFKTLAAEVVANCRAMNAGVVFVWDASVDDLQPVGKYVGDPRLQHPAFAGQVARDFFATLRAAGLQVAVTLRWERLGRDVFGNWDRLYPASPAWSIMGKAQWAHQNYGTTHFYIDSNVDDAGTLDVRPLLVLKAQCPWATFWWEHVESPNDNAWHGWAAPDYQQIGGRWIDPRFTNPIPDDGFKKLIGGMDVPDESRFPEFVREAKAGSLLLFRCWGGVDKASNPWADFVARVSAAR